MGIGRLQLPLTPVGVQAAAISQTQIGVSWTNVAGATGYRVERSADGVSGWPVVGSMTADVRSFVDSGLSANTTYF
jgi:hypothetical protein